MPSQLPPPETQADDENVRRFRWGIFEVAYELPPSTPLFSKLFPSAVQDSRESFRPAFRLFRELYSIAPKAYTTYNLGCLWLSIAPALSLYLSYSVLSLIQQFISNGQSGGANFDHLRALSCMWLFSASFSVLMERVIDEQKLVLMGHLRAHFLPQLAKASLQLDVIHDYRVSAAYPQPWAFGEGAPGWSFVEELSTRVRNILTLTLEVFVLLHIISQTRNPDAQVLMSIGLLFITVILLSPSNGVGGAGYVFWTTNLAYHRLNSLYSIIFDQKYRRTVAKDGMAQYLCKEYKRASDGLGPVKTDILALACHIPVPWHWVFLRSIIIDHPMALCAVALPWTLSPSTLVSMALIQNALSTLRMSIECLKGGQDPASFMEIVGKAQEFYKTLKPDTPLHRGNESYPDPIASSSKGMKLSFRNVSFSYPDSTHKDIYAVRDVSFDIRPGQLVVIVGVNGSGKSSLLQLIARLAEPTAGKILVDDKPVADYDLQQLRRSIAFLTQSEEIYPVSLRDNILMGMADCERLQLDEETLRERIGVAAEMGGSHELLQRLGEKTILNRIGIFGQSMRGCGNGEIGPGAFQALNRNSPGRAEISISCGEKQRLVASRTFMRVNNGGIKLLVVDEPTSAMDPHSERKLIDNFCDAREGKTTIFVTHRFGNLVKRADLILCMKAGKVVERGTHETLMRKGGQYATLYTIQAQGFQ